MPSNPERFSDLPLSFLLAVIGSDEEATDSVAGDHNAELLGDLAPERELEITG